jgi:guanylate kinase
MARGALILIIGPTGSGKSVLIDYIHKEFPEIGYLKTYTTRARRSSMESAHYEFIDDAAFDSMIAAGDFIEWAHFGGARYGTSRTNLEEGLAAGKVLLKEMEVQGIRQTMEQLPREELKLFYVDAGSWDELEKRVRARAPITEEELAKRRQRYDDELPFKDNADVVIRNYAGELEEAKTRFKEAVHAVIESVR